MDMILNEAFIMIKISPPTKSIIETETEIICPRCGGKFSYNDNDVSEFNSVQCPWCNRDIELKNIKRNFGLFPNDFFHYSKDEAVEISREETQKYIDEIKAEENRLNPGEFCYISTSDTCIIGLKYDNEFVIIVSKDFYETSRNYE